MQTLMVSLLASHFSEMLKHLHSHCGDRRTPVPTEPRQHRDHRSKGSQYTNNGRVFLFQKQLMFPVENLKVSVRKREKSPITAPQLRGNYYQQGGGQSTLVPLPPHPWFHTPAANHSPKVLNGKFQE